MGRGLGFLDGDLVGLIVRGGLLGNLVGWVVIGEGKSVGSSVGEREGDSVSRAVGTLATVGPVVGRTVRGRFGGLGVMG